MTADYLFLIILAAWFFIIIFRGLSKYDAEEDSLIDVEDYVTWEKYSSLASRTGQKNLKILPGKIIDPEIIEKHIYLLGKSILQGQGVTVYFKKRWIQGIFLGVKDKAIKILSESGEIYYINPGEVDNLRVYNI
jgi:hypothetical protein